jgi:hypothetical protein
MTSPRRRTDHRPGYPPPALTAAVLALITVVLALWAVAVIGETSARALATYTPVEATVVDEHTEMRLVADRRGSRPEPFRVVTVQLADGGRADLRSDDLVVGASATVYRSDSGAVFESPPARPGLLEWSLCAGVVAAAVVMALVSVRVVLRLRPAS